MLKTTLATSMYVRYVNRGPRQYSASPSPSEPVAAAAPAPAVAPASTRASESKSFKPFLVPFQERVVDSVVDVVARSVSGQAVVELVLLTYLVVRNKRYGLILG